MLPEKTIHQRIKDVQKRIAVLQAVLKIYESEREFVVMLEAKKIGCPREAEPEQ